jgi:hypothetical protein
MRSALLLTAAIFLMAGTANASQDELARLNAQIMNNPTSVELNLRYAQVAEEEGDYGKALAAYERALDADPGNGTAQRGQLRAAARMLPNTFEMFTELGSGYESNPHNFANTKHGEGEIFARALFKDDRTLGDTRWRTTGFFAGNIYQDSSDLGYGYAGLATGPVYLLSPSLSFHPSIGAGASYFDHHFFYSEVFASSIIEGNYQLTNYTVRLRGGYRSYDDFFPSSNGFFADLTGKFSHPGVITSDDLVVFSPWLRWSGVDTIDNLNTLVSPDDFLTGRYGEVGARLEYYKPIVDWMTASVNYSYLDRIYASAIDSGGNKVNRRDQIGAPGAALIFRNKFGAENKGSVRVDYRYERDDSNTQLGSYTNHVGTITFFNRY